MRRSAAIAICSPIWCAGCWRTAPTPPSSPPPPIRTCPSSSSCAAPADVHRRAGAGQRHRACRCRRDIYGPSRRNSRGVEFGDRAALDALLAEVDAGRAISAATVASLIGGVPVAARAPPGASRPIDGETADRRGRRTRRPAAWRTCSMAAAGRLRGLVGNAGGNSAPPPWSAPPICWRPGAAASSSCSQVEGGKTLDDAVSPRCARRSISAAITPREGAQALRPRRDAARPDRRVQHPAPARPRRVRLHLALEFPARDLHSARSPPR